MEKKFKALRSVGLIFKILGGIVLIGSVILFIVAIFTGLVSADLFGGRFGMPRGAGLYGGLLTFVWGLLTGLFLFGTGEVIDLLLAIEENTRATRILMEERRNIS